MEKQVEKNHYRFEKYSHLSRWVSYYYQLREIMKKKPRSVLEVGVGDKVVGTYLQHNTAVEYTSMDIAEYLSPDVVGDLRDMPFEDNLFDIVVAFEVLEHLPFEDFEKAMKELRRVAREYIIISLPHFGPPVQFSLKIPLLKRVQFARKIPYHPKHEFNGQHYWEIGKRGYEIIKIKNILREYFELEDDFVPFASQYHHFFILRVPHTRSDI